MPSKAALILAFAFVPLADAQVDRVMHFTSTQTIQAFQEIGTGVNKIADVQTTIDAPEKALMMHGTGDEIALAEWLFNDLDKPVIAGKHQYQVSNSGDDVVQIFYLRNTETMQRLQEVSTTVRSIGDIKRSFTYNALRAVAVRGTPDQAALAEFLFTEIDKPGIEPGSSQQSRSSPAHIYRPDSAEGVVRVFYLPNTKTVQNFQELVTTVRTVVNVRRLFTYNAPRAVVVRGTAEQIELADWLFNELDKPTNSKNAHPPEYHLPTASDDVVRVFYLSNVQTVQRLQEIAVQAQSVTHQRAVLPYTAARAVIMRGTTAEIAEADRLIKARDR
jgi:hypothetical protein